jgi:hypothetical protein
VFCFDDLTYNVLKQLNYKNIVLYQRAQFETKELLKIKNSKEKAYEYYWAIKAFLVRKVLQEENINMATYIDCDFLFFQSPEIIFEEMGNADILIQPNNFSFMRVSDFIPVGYYCSCFEVFRNTKNGLRILSWWHKRCIEWCHSRFEDNKFADQKYLDDWKLRFKNVREILNIGANVAPWNIHKFDISKINKKIVINNKWPLIYYHFHSLRMNLSDYSFMITGDRENTYQIPKNVIDLLYKPYIKRMRETIKNLKKIKEYREYANNINPEGKYLTK